MLGAAIGGECCLEVCQARAESVLAARQHRVHRRAHFVGDLKVLALQVALADFGGAGGDLQPVGDFDRLR